MGFSWPIFIPSAQAFELNIYAGPQSITPLEMIHVTVQSAVQKTAVELSYISDEGLKIRTGMTEQGLISFDVPAQKTVGKMRFTAKAGQVVSNMALVTVIEGTPQSFMLFIKQGKQARTIDISSSIIKDAFENPISNLALVSLDWIDRTGLNTSQYIQPSHGRVIINAKCPNDFVGALTVRAAVNSAEYISNDISSFCREQTQLDVR